MWRGLTFVVTAVALVIWSAGAASAGTGWLVQAMPSPPSSPNSNNVLDGISCASSASCVAVGSYVNSAGIGVTLAEYWNGSTWAIQHTPNPVAAPNSALQQVSCTSPTSCTAVGEYLTSSGAGFTLAEHWNGSTWSIQDTPNPAGAAVSSLYDVSCASPTSCTAVGQYLDSSDAGFTLAEHWNGSKWWVQATPKPHGATNFSTLVGISCARARSCTAVGWYDTSGPAAAVMLAEHWDGSSRWSVQATPSPAGSASSLLHGVSCPSPTSCTAVGQYTNSSRTALTVAEYWNGSIWSVQATPSPAGSANSALNGVSCATAHKCTAVGYVNASGGTRPLAEHWNGSTWAIQHTQRPPGSYFNYLNAVSCPSTRSCTAVGWYNKGFQAPSQLLAEAK